MDSSLIKFEIEKGKEDAIEYVKTNKLSKEDIKKEYEKVKKEIEDMLKDYGTRAYEELDYWYLLGWKRGLYECLKKT